MQVFKKIWICKLNNGAYITKITDWKLPHSKQKQKKPFYSLQNNMTKTAKIILWLLIAIIIGLVAYSVAIQDKVRAWNDLIKTQARLDELDRLIKEEQEKYAYTDIAKAECIEYRDKEKDRAHDSAEKYRIEIKEIQGFLLNR